ncbi:MAG: hypothetical protein WD601_13980 [Pseudohongiellaceae bacterium]
MPEVKVVTSFYQLVFFSVALILTACSDSSAPVPQQTAAADTAATPVRETPRYEDGTVRFDRVPGEKGYWDNPSARSLVEDGVDVPMDENGLLANIADAERVAPFMPWALGLYRYRQENGLQDDPARVCISPAGPRHFHVDGGLRIIQDRSYNRVYVLFGGGNRGWRVIYLDGREAPDPEEVVGTYYGHSAGHWEGDTLVVESTGFIDRFWFSSGGQPHTAALSLTERFSRPDHDTLQYEVTVTDPLTYTRPWTSSWTLDWIEGGEIEETFCEDSRD